MHKSAAQEAGVDAGPHLARHHGYSGYLSLIDGVRGIAAVAVLLYHYIHFFMAGPSRAPLRGAIWMYPGSAWLSRIYIDGFLAVQIFWLISGFVFAQVYYGSNADTRSFAINRFARLYPLHLLTLLVVAGLEFAMLRRFGYTALYGNYDWPHFFRQLLFASDWLHLPGDGYSFNGPIWSVSVEVVVYALFWMSRRAVVRFGLPLVAVLVAGFYFADHAWTDFTKIFACGYYFFIGCGLNLVLRGNWNRGWRLVAPVLLLVALGAWGAWVNQDWSWRFVALPGLFGALFMMLAVAEPFAPGWLRKGCQWLGENTYGVYLWHVPVQLCLLLVLLPGTNPAEVARHGWFMVLFVALVLVVARLSYVWFERPVRDWLRRRLHSHLGRLKGSDNAP
ncbi:MAG: acyltransferase [Candidatus Andeanibacterium colombiense]|uniref:Acyltransferase n=1 Tax=Candidatus Andeanibacterium colombiense TaxID=3121345 RepID=A0AAJ5X6M1_9SPHN|nr:MAG: acyltransferase [Sphingomonadaceae bacterium]